MTEPKRMVPIEEAIEDAEAAVDAAWCAWSDARAHLAELRALAASGATDVEEP